jgi:translation initiation factor 2-alpha kinase 4
VRYYTTWVETADPDENVASSDDSSIESGTEDMEFMTSVPRPSSPNKLNPADRQPINGGFHINIEDFDDLSLSGMSFPSIHFGMSSPGGSENSGEDSTSSEEQDEFASFFKGGRSKSESKNIRAVSPAPTAPAMTRTLYIQMVSRQVILKADLRLHCVRNLLNDKH